MNMQQMMAQAQKMQRELRKAQAELAAKEFVVSKGGAVTVTVYGSKQIKSVSEAMEQIDQESDAINERITGQRGGFGF